MGFKVFFYGQSLAKARKGRMASVNGKRTIGSIKELTDELRQKPGRKTNPRLFAPAEGAAPSKLRGWGEFFIRGKGEDFPFRDWAAPKVLALGRAFSFCTWSVAECQNTEKVTLTK